jgi:DNA-directed RNA polymerase specialized sigma subunit
MYHNDEHFRLFISNLELAIDRYEGENDTESQKAQIEKLVGLEKDFRKALVRHQWGSFSYKDFLGLILDKKRNILMARPYFRERNEIFQAEISDIIRTRNYRAMYRYHVNFNFIEFVMKSRQWHKVRSGRKLVRIYKEIKAIRRELVERNMPLAISEARLFYSKTPKAHLAYMDMVQIASDGLVSAVDKFVLPYSTVFRAVIIGRIRGNLIESYSETYLHFYPGDKRRIYRAHKAIGQLKDGGHIDYDAVVRIVNLDEEKTLVSTGELINLLSAASVVSANALPLIQEEDDPPVNPIDRYADLNETRPDILLEEEQARDAVSSSIARLTVFERKLFKLKGIDL